MFGTDLKNRLTTIFAGMGALSGAIFALQQMGVVLPVWALTLAAILATLSVTGIGFLTGKNPDGSTKTAVQVGKIIAEKDATVDTPKEEVNAVVKSITPTVLK